MRSFGFFGLPLVLMVLAAGGRADVVHLKDGRVIVGEVAPIRSFDPVTIETLDGTVSIEPSEILLHEPASRLARTLRASIAQADGDASRILSAARWAARKGLYADAIELADRALSEDSRIELPEEILGLPVAGMKRNSVIDAAGARRLLDVIAEPSRPAAARVAAERLASNERSPATTEVFLDGVANRAARVRLAALRGMTGAVPHGAVPAVIDRMLTDPVRDVRSAATDALRHANDDRIVRGVVQSLESSDPRLREAAMDAAESLRLVRAVGALVRNLKRAEAAGGGAGPLSYVAVTEQRSYVSDFDVDVANSAFIANPNVGVLQSGVVLNGRVLDTTRHRVSVSERDRIGRLLDALTGRSFGTDAGRWDEWLTEPDD